MEPVEIVRSGTHDDFESSEESTSILSPPRSGLSL